MGGFWARTSLSAYISYFSYKSLSFGYRRFPWPPVQYPSPFLYISCDNCCICYFCTLLAKQDSASAKPQRMSEAIGGLSGASRLGQCAIAIFATGQKHIVCIGFWTFHWNLLSLRGVWHLYHVLIMFLGSFQYCKICFRLLLPLEGQSLKYSPNMWLTYVMTPGPAVWLIKSIRTDCKCR